MNLLTVSILICLIITLFLLNYKKREYHYPAMLLITTFAGMLIGNEGIGGLYFNNPQIIGTIGIIGLIVLLFNAGINVNWRKLNKILSKGLILSFLSVIISTILVGLIVYALTDFELVYSFIIGALFSATDFVFVKRFIDKLNLISEVKSLIKIENGLNTVIIYFIVTNLLFFISIPQTSFWHMFTAFEVSIVIGIFCGLVLGEICYLLLTKITNKDLQVTSAIVLTVLIYLTSTYLDGNGFLSVYIFAIILTNSHLTHINLIKQVSNWSTKVIQIVIMFLLGILVLPSYLCEYVLSGIFISLVLLLIIRPISVFLSLNMYDFDFRNKSLISLISPKGVAPILLATPILVANIPAANMSFYIIFFIIIISLVYHNVVIENINYVLDMISKKLGINNGKIDEE